MRSTLRAAVVGTAMAAILATAGRAAARPKTTLEPYLEIELQRLESLTSIDTPMRRPWLWTVEWVDMNAARGVKGYELTCRAQAGNVCTGAEFKTAGFTLKAPEVELADTGDEVRVTILSKVAR